MPQLKRWLKSGITKRRMAENWFIPIVQVQTDADHRLNHRNDDVHDSGSKDEAQSCTSHSHGHAKNELRMPGSMSIQNTTFQPSAT